MEPDPNEIGCTPRMDRRMLVKLMLAIVTGYSLEVGP
jgi:hypothetical protein